MSQPYSHGRAHSENAAKLDSLPALCDYADKLEKATIDTIEDGVMTGDLAAMSTLENKRKVDSEEFLVEIGKRLDLLLG